LCLGATDIGLQAYVGFDPACIAVLEFVAAALKCTFHRGWDPELHRSAHERSIEALGRHANNRVRHIVQALPLADDLAIAFEATAPQLIADDDDWMGVTAYVLARFEASPEHGMDSGSVKVVRRNDAAGRYLGMVADVQRAAGNFADEPVLAERATSL
jgi:hypothetical protein